MNIYTDVKISTLDRLKNHNKKKEKGFFQIAYANVIEIVDLKISKADLEKIILSDLQIMMYQELEEKFLNILQSSGLPDLKFGNKIDFEKLYKERSN